MAIDVKPALSVATDGTAPDVTRFACPPAVVTAVALNKAPVSDNAELSFRMLYAKRFIKRLKPFSDYILRHLFVFALTIYKTMKGKKYHESLLRRRKPGSMMKRD